MPWWEKLRLLLVFGYIALYGTLGLQGLCEGYFAKGLSSLRQVLAAEGTSWGVFLAELVAFPLACAGMVLYTIEIDHAVLSDVWKIVLLLLLALFPVERAHHFRQFVKEPDERLTSKQMSEAGVLFAVVTSILEVPCLWMNFRVAFPS
jgi:hypothetical protein